jgi:hypothetical protein
MDSFEPTGYATPAEASCADIPTINVGDGPYLRGRSLVR